MTTTDPAATLSAAAEKLRTLAEGATPGRWAVWAMSVLASVDGTMNVDTALPVCDTHHESGLRTWNADYIAAMSPPVALALADLFEVIAQTTQNIGGFGKHAVAALAIARIVLGDA